MATTPLVLVDSFNWEEDEATRNFALSLVRKLRNIGVSVMIFCRRIQDWKLLKKEDTVLNRIIPLLCDTTLMNEGNKAAITGLLPYVSNIDHIVTFDESEFLENAIRDSFAESYTKSRKMLMNETSSDDIKKQISEGRSKIIFKVFRPEKVNGLAKITKHASQNFYNGFNSALKYFNTPENPAPAWETPEFHDSLSRGLRPIFEAELSKFEERFEAIKEEFCEKIAKLSQEVKIQPTTATALTEKIMCSSSGIFKNRSDITCWESSTILNEFESSTFKLEQEINTVLFELQIKLLTALDNNNF